MFDEPEFCPQAVAEWYEFSGGSQLYNYNHSRKDSAPKPKSISLHWVGRFGMPIRKAGWNCVINHHEMVRLVYIALKIACERCYTRRRSNVRDLVEVVQLRPFHHLLQKHTLLLLQHSCSNCGVESKLSVALGVMHECFEPMTMIDALSGRDIVADVIFSRFWREMMKCHNKDFWPESCTSTSCCHQKPV